MSMQPTPPEPVYYFDTNALWKFYCDQKGDLNVRRLVARSPSQVLVSPLTVVEFVGVLMEYYRKRLLKRTQVNAIVKRLRRDVGKVNPHRPFRIVDVPAASFREAESILLLHAGDCAIQTIDALHLAIAIRLNVPPGAPVVFVTSDHALQHVAQKRDLCCYNPEVT